MKPRFSQTYREESMGEGRWPAEGTPLVAGVQPPGFDPVTQEVLAEIVRRIVAALHPDKIILFGSYVYGTPSGDSDVDLLIILEWTAPPPHRSSARPGSAHRVPVVGAAPRHSDRWRPASARRHSRRARHDLHGRA